MEKAKLAFPDDKESFTKEFVALKSEVKTLKARLQEEEKLRSQLEIESKTWIETREHLS